MANQKVMIHLLAGLIKSEYNSNLVNIFQSRNL